MKRRYWWMALFAPQAVAQENILEEKKAAIRYLDRMAKDHFEPPVNNQCPVCGMMAKEFVRPTTTDSHLTIDREAEAKWAKDHPGESKYWVTIIPPVPTPYGPSFNLTRCKHCNAAFWQDAEGA